MLRPLAVACWAALVLPAPLGGPWPFAPIAHAQPAEIPQAALDRSRALLAQGDAIAAVTALEDGLASADAATRPALIEALRTAYEQAARQAEAVGKTREAEQYRENLAILARKPRPASTPAMAPAPKPAAPAPAPVPPAPRTAPVEPQTVTPAPATAPAAEPVRPRSASPDPGPPAEPPAPLPLPPSDDAVQRASTEPEPRAEPQAPRPKAAANAPAAPDETPLFDALPGAEAIEPKPLRNAPAPATRPEPRTGSAAPAPVPAAEEAAPEPLGPGSSPPAAPAARQPAASPEPDRSTPGMPADAPAPATSSTQGELTQADAAFRQRNYAGAGRLYSKLAEADELPENRKGVWAYCRRFQVVQRINAHPTTADEWQAIATEIEQIRQIAGKHWYDEYLMSLVKERSKGASTRPRQAPAAEPQAKAGPRATSDPALSKVAVRGQSPAAPPSASTRLAAAGPRDRTLPAEANPAGAPLASPTLNRWQVLDTANFRIFHTDPALARQVGEVAEATRSAQLRRWSGSESNTRWVPVCEVFLYPNAAIFSQQTGQPPDSPGFSTSGLMAGRVTARRVNLRTDHPKLVAAILPHEVTHIVLAELFPEQQIPRWADEGMAVLAEPSDEQQHRAADLHAPLRGGKIFSVDQLMVMDYPEGQHWPLYYAQSISLTKYLVELDSPVRFVEFVRDAQKHGFEPALQRHYQISSYRDLQERWLVYAQQSSEPAAEKAPALAADTGTALQQ